MLHAVYGVFGRSKNRSIIPFYGNKLRMEGAHGFRTGIVCRMLNRMHSGCTTYIDMLTRPERTDTQKQVSTTHAAAAGLLEQLEERNPSVNVRTSSLLGYMLGMWTVYGLCGVYACVSMHVSIYSSDFGMKTCFVCITTYQHQRR